MRYRPFEQQKEFFLDPSRIRCLFAAKRSGKTEIGLLDAIHHAQSRPGWTDNGRDPYIVVLIAPTDAMLKRITWPKFLAFARGFIAEYNKSENRALFKNGTVVYGVSAEKIQRVEGLKVNYILLDEAFQMISDVFYEALARTSDAKGKIVIMGSLGTNIPNPKGHWLYKVFKEGSFDDARIWEWTTAQNPYFPREELDRLKGTLDPRTYRQLFAIDWNVPGTALVYDTFDEANMTRGYAWRDPGEEGNEHLETWVAVDWGYAHPMVALFFQLDRKDGTAILFDEIILRRQTREVLYDRIRSKPYKITGYICDVAGNKETEETGISNVSWFRAPPRNIPFKYRRTQIAYGVSVVRQFIRNGKGEVHFLVDERCKASLDDLRNYRYPEKDGVILNEKPEKDNANGSFDAIDAIRYFFVNRLDPAMQGSQFQTADRWKTWKF